MLVFAWEGRGKDIIYRFRFTVNVMSFPLRCWTPLGSSMLQRSGPNRNPPRCVPAESSRRKERLGKRMSAGCNLILLNATWKAFLATIMGRQRKLHILFSRSCSLSCLKALTAEAAQKDNWAVSSSLQYIEQIHKLAPQTFSN